MCEQLEMQMKNLNSLLMLSIFQSDDSSAISTEVKESECSDETEQAEDPTNKEDLNLFPLEFIIHGNHQQ